MDRALALRLKMHKLTHCGINAPIIFSEVHGGKLTSGWCTVNKSTCWHVWVVMDDGTIIDVIRTLCILNNPEFKECDFELSLEGTGEMDTETIENWELYNKSPSEYWSKQPKNIRDFKSKYKSQFQPKC